MAPLKDVPSLQDLSIITVETAVLEICAELFSYNSYSLEWTQMFETLEVLLGVPIAPCHRDRFAKICRLALKALDSDNSARVRRNDYGKKHVSLHLLSKLIGCKPTSINLDELEETWSKLSHCFDELQDLRIFSCGTNFLLHENRSVFVEKVLAACRIWSNLRVFIFRYGCTDEIISSISEHCSQLRELDVSSSKNITDSCVPQLIKCRNLEALSLKDTSITASGLSDFLLKSESQSLIFINCGFQKSPGAFVEAISSWNCDTGIKPAPLSLIQRLACDELNVTVQKELTHFFPNLSELEITFKSVVPSLGCLQGLQKLKKLSLILAEKPAGLLLNEIPVIGSAITSLVLMCSDKSELNWIFNVISSSCPNLDSLVLIQHQRFSEDYFPWAQPKPPPFQKLKNICWSDHVQTSYLAYILKYAYNVEDIDLFELKLPGNVSITDEFFEAILKVNPLSQLKRLCCTSSQLSVGMFKNLLKSCKSLSSMSISLQEDDIKDIEAFVKEKNYDLKELLVFDPFYY